MVRFLIGAAFWGAALIEGRPLLEGGTCSDICVNGVALTETQRLFEVQRLL